MKVRLNSIYFLKYASEIPIYLAKRLYTIMVMNEQKLKQEQNDLSAMISKENFVKTLLLFFSPSSLNEINKVVFQM